MRIAIISDIHGNSIALDAVLEDVKTKAHVDAHWFLGDYAAIGFDPIGCLERVSELTNAVFLRGNTDRYIMEDLAAGNVPTDPTKLAQFLKTQLSFAWTQGAVASTGWLEWLTDLPLDYRTTMADGTRVLAVHASPGSDDSPGLHPGQDQENLRQLFGNCEADLVFVGHTHVNMDVGLDDMRLVNPGSISNPTPPELRASYIVLDDEKTGYKLTQNFVEYDRKAVIDEVNRVRHPAADYINTYMRGEHIPFWLK